MKYTPENITTLEPNQIFVFGSNEQGIHRSGAAKQALKFGAELGNGVGLQGQCYAIPTKSTPWITLPLNSIRVYVDEFYYFVIENPDYQFLITKIGCGLAGYNFDQIAPLFKNFKSLNNVTLPMEFYIGNDINYGKIEF